MLFRSTPLVFLFAGLIFAATAVTYTEGTAMFPEAGGSSSFARQAFNDSVMRYNERVATFPTNLVAALFRFARAEPWMTEAETRAVPGVRLGHAS